MQNTAPIIAQAQLLYLPQDLSVMWYANENSDVVQMAFPVERVLVVGKLRKAIDPGN